MLYRRHALLVVGVIHQISRSHGRKIDHSSESNLSKITRPVAAFKSLRFALFVMNWFLNPVILVYICSSLPDQWPGMYTRYVSLSIQNPNLEFLSNSFLCLVYIFQNHWLQPQHNFYFPLYCYMWHLSFFKLCLIRMFNVFSETYPEGLVLISCSQKLLKQRNKPFPLQAV